MHQARDKITFDKLWEIFVKKYSTKYPDFVKYFEGEWVQKNNGWHYDAENIAPTTNSALESFNGSLKSDLTFRRKLPVKEFILCLFEWIEKWSSSYHTENLKNRKVFKTIPDISKTLWVEAKTIASNSMKKMTTKTRENNYEVKIASGEKNEWTVHDRRNFQSFKEFSEIANNFYIVKIPKRKEDFLAGTCDCEDFFKENVCVHLIAVALRMQHTTVPISASTIKLSEKSRQGRPALAKKTRTRARKIKSLGKKTEEK